MLVTFVSQCQKNALKRTRRILDTFANRIGDNVWQTPITEEGLETVRRLLKASATKSTAVSCHRIRTRKHTQLVWVVGRKDAFNELGFVPVNYTTKELFMDLPIESKNILANTHGQMLSSHLFAVGYLAYQLINKLNIASPNLAQSAFVAGVLHDIGKIDPQFQLWVSKKYDKSQSIDKFIDLPDDGVHIDSTVKNLGKFSFEKHPRHHELSWLFASSLLNSNDTLNNAQIEQIYHSIYWHHTRPYRSKEQSKYFDKAEGIDKLLQESLNVGMGKIIDQIATVLKEVALIGQKFQIDGVAIDGVAFDKLLPKWSYPYQLTGNSLPCYKKYNDLSDKVVEFVQDIKPNALNNLVRMAVITADRLVSKMPAEDLTAYLADGSLINALDDIWLDKNTLSDEIAHCLQGFDIKYPNSERNQSQSKAADELAQIQENAAFDERDNVSVLQGPAGCGKTKIALEWAMKTDAQKIIWVCPRVQVCLGLLHDLTQSNYLPNSRIEIFTGEYKKILVGEIGFDDAPETASEDYFSGDIVITTIDQVVHNIISHQKVVGMIDFMQSHVVFDEFHELIVKPAFNLLFAELIEAKKMRQHLANTLLISATPHDYFVSKVLGIDTNDIVRVPSFNQADYHIDFVSYADDQNNPLITNRIDDNKTTFIITNTAVDAQVGYLYHHNQENSILLHSKYTRQDKAKWFNKVFDSFKQHGSKHYQILRSGPIVQASLNISCERMFTDLTSAENWLQRLGRLDRFDDNKAINHYTTVLPNSAKKGKQTSNTAKFLNHLSLWQSTVAWLNFIKNYLQDHDKPTIKINELYQVYQAFYADNQCQEKIKADLILALKNSVDLINQKVIDPMSIPINKIKQDGIVKIASMSLRGDNRFVQMAVCDVDNELNIHYLDEYAYPENTDHSQIVIGLTESVDRIQGGKGNLTDSNKNLLAFMHKKHHNIMAGKYPNETFKKTKFDWQLLQFARSPEYPIYLSYTPTDLEPIGGERERHPYGMYYVTTNKQPVGVMCLDTIINLKTTDKD